MLNLFQHLANMKTKLQSGLTLNLRKEIVIAYAGLWHFLCQTSSE